MNAATDRLAEIVAKHRAGDHALAEKEYQDHLRDFPEDPTALHFLGLLRTQQGRHHEGIELMDAAVRIDPAYVDAWSNLGIAFYQQRDLDRAEKCCRKAIELSPGFANAWGNLGMALRAKDCYEETLQAWSRALELDPGMRNIAISYGQLLYKMGRVGQACDFYDRWCKDNPEDPIATHMLAAMGGSQQPERASDGFVRATFDDFAESFDEQLKSLQYKAPQLLHRATMASANGRTEAALNVLDLGCGTGLCGTLFRPLAKRLVGVDLSSKMLAKAAARGCYEQLNFAELTEYLAACRDRFDLVLAADVLCYFGVLSGAFAGVRGVLAPQGRFIFSLEAASDRGMEPGFTLKPHGRYEHEHAYVQSVLGEAGLRIESLTNETLRFERGKPVAGFVIVTSARL
jgi:predicted TPR repeat methyltransferase